MHCIVLAAGASTRFGSPKQLARRSGRTLLQAAVARAVEVAGSAVTVVIGAHAAEVSASLPMTRARLLVNRQWAEGIGSSIRCAMQNLPSGCEGVLVTLADQAALEAADLQKLVGAWYRNPGLLVAAQYGAVTGVPAVFPAWSFPSLRECRGDIGAQPVIRRHQDRLLRVPLLRAAVDIDRPADLVAVETQIGLHGHDDPGA